MVDLIKAMTEKYEEVDYRTFYRDIFPVGSFENPGVYQEGKYNGILVEVEKDGSIIRHTVLDDLAKLDEVVQRDKFCIMAPISYIGKSRKSENARDLYAIAIDLDGIKKDKHLRVFFNQIYRRETLRYYGVPVPTYIVCSGTGLHIYYVFEKPIRLYPNVAAKLEILKRRLTWQLWTQGASTLTDNVQYESLYQGFRVVGTITKVGTRVRAFKVGPKTTLEEIHKNIPDEYQAVDLEYKPKLPLAEAKKKFPDWYQKRIVEGQPKGCWKCKRALYDWWKRRLIAEIQEGHRYWGVMTLAVYAKKCGIGFEELKADAIDLIPTMNDGAETPFTMEDTLHALEAYRDSYRTYPIDTIIKRTDLWINKNKRNGRKQAVHVKFMNNVRAFKVDLGECTNGGRPSKKEVVLRWRLQNPGGRKVDCIRETGLSKPTVLKWWGNGFSPRP